MTEIAAFSKQGDSAASEIVPAASESIEFFTAAGSGPYPLLNTVYPHPVSAKKFLVFFRLETALRCKFP
jgi:hypothetical protein